MIQFTGVYGFFAKYYLSVCRDRNNLEKQYFLLWGLSSEATHNFSVFLIALLI